jgi:predicted ArsR family transcriptional regulator
MLIDEPGATCGMAKVSYTDLYLTFVFLSIFYGVYLTNLLCQRMLTLVRAMSIVLRLCLVHSWHLDDTFAARFHSSTRFGTRFIGATKGTYERVIMMATSWYLRFLTSTRGRLVALLRRDIRTVEEMASELQLSDNAVRAHLAALERDGLVRQQGVRRSGMAGKPAHAYELTADAEQLFPKPYAIVLNNLLDALDGRVSSDMIADILRTAGKRISRQFPRGLGDERSRINTAVEALNQFGGLAESENTEGEIAIQGFGCPFAAVVPHHPEMCSLAAAFVGEIAGEPMREACNRESSPRCRFEPVEGGAANHMPLA